MAAHEEIAPPYSPNVPDPPSYLTANPPSPAQVLQRALEDLSGRSKPGDSPFYTSPNLRRNPGPEALQRDLVKAWQNLPSYQAKDITPKDEEKLSECLVEAFFAAIISGSTSLVEQFLQTDLLDANTPKHGNETGLTPLLCAVQFGHDHVMAILISKGAHIDDFGVCRPFSTETLEYRGPEETKRWLSETAVRTPLQFAAQLGNLPLVKKLMESYSADDSLIAPDGQLALRLASSNGHKEVVKYLPARRGGGFRRWKTKHHKIMKRVQHSIDIIRATTVFTFYKAPKWCIQSSAEFVKDVTAFCWKNKHKFPGWLWKLTKEIWDAVVHLIVNSPRYARNLVKYTGKLLVWLWKYAVELVTNKIPKAAKLIWQFLVKTAQDIGNAILWIVNRAASFLHTVLNAVLNALKSLTWQNIRDGFVDLMRAIFINFPQILFKGLKSAIKTTGEVLVALFGGLAFCVYGLAYIICWILLYFAKHTWKVLTALGRSTWEGGKEVQLWINPKA